MKHIREDYQRIQDPADEEILPEPGTYHFKPNEG